MSNNGPQYSGGEFSQFADEWDFHQVTSCPTYPQYNGLAERTVHTIKRLIKKKVKEEKKYPCLNLLEIRNTPVHGLASPAQLSVFRRLRYSIPCTTKHLRPAVVEPSVIENMLKRKQTTQQTNYDKSRKDLEPVHSVEHVRLRTAGTTPHWEPAICLQIVLETLSNQSVVAYINETGDTS